MSITNEMFENRGRSLRSYFTNPIDNYKYQCKTNPIPTAVTTLILIGLVTYGVMSLVAHLKGGAVAYNTINEFLKTHKMTAITALTAAAVTGIVCYAAFRTHVRIREWNDIENKMLNHDGTSSKKMIGPIGPIGRRYGFSSRQHLDEHLNIGDHSQFLLKGSGCSLKTHAKHPIATFQYQVHTNPIPTFFRISITITAIVIGIMALVHYYGNGVDAYKDLEIFVLKNKVDVITGALSSLATMIIAHAAYRTHARIWRCNKDLYANGYLFGDYADDKYAVNQFSWLGN